jgi:hypothetical protein
MKDRGRRDSMGGRTKEKQHGRQIIGGQQEGQKTGDNIDAQEQEKQHGKQGTK